jgi:hypothetical protein
MRFIRERLGRTTGPVLVCAAILAVLGITAAVAAPKFVTGKKVVTTITKKVQGQDLQVTNQRDLVTTGFDLNQPTALLASLPLAKGSYMVHATATASRANGGVTISCELRVNKRIDKTEISGGAGGSTDVALGASGGVPGNGSAQLLCSDGSPALNEGILKNIEIQALRVPKLTLRTIP